MLDVKMPDGLGGKLTDHDNGLGDAIGFAIKEIFQP